MNITSITYDLPGKRVLLADLVKSAEIPLSEACIFEKVMGLRFAVRGRAETYEKQLMTILAKFFKAHPINKTGIRYCIYAHTADDIAPAGVSVFERAIKKFGLLKSEFFGVSLHKCASVFQLFILSQQLFDVLSCNDIILLIIADVTFTPVLRYIPGSTVLSDSSLLVQLKKSDFHRFVIDVYLGEQGCFSRGVFGSHKEQLLFQSTYLDNLVSAILAVLHKNSMKLSQIKKIFPHNVNIFSWKQVAKILQISVDKIYLDNVSRNAHCFGADPFINLADADYKGLLKTGDYVILVTVGLGATFAAMLLKY